jgi:hypothetical protein
MLLMAVIIACAWGRSYVVMDTITIPVGENQSHFLISFNGRFNWASITGRRPGFRKLSWTWNSERLSVNDKSWTSQHSLTDHWQYCGFGVWECRLRDAFHRVLVIPYWPIVLSLTLVSASLILRKPRKCVSEVSSDVTTSMNANSTSG